MGHLAKHLSRPYGTQILLADTVRSDESLGYFRMSLWDKHTTVGWPVRLRWANKCPETSKGWDVSVRIFLKNN